MKVNGSVEVTPNHRLDRPLTLLGFFRRKAAPQDRPDADDRKQVGGDARAHDLLDAIGFRQGRGYGIEGRHIREAPALTPPLFDIPKRRPALAKLLGRMRRRLDQSECPSFPVRLPICFGPPKLRMATYRAAAGGIHRGSIHPRSSAKFLGAVECFRTSGRISK